MGLFSISGEGKLKSIDSYRHKETKIDRTTDTKWEFDCQLLRATPEPESYQNPIWILSPSEYRRVDSFFLPLTLIFHCQYQIIFLDVCFASQWSDIWQKKKLYWRNYRLWTFLASFISTSFFPFFPSKRLERSRTCESSQRTTKKLISSSK